ncbi:TcpD family membrane protein [Paenibacillus larvae]|uniref:TcpD family membrane protein n=1 Tax=Paenibacillus larvae TaxID=1464 RepID=UPI0005A97F3C|nr:TcpD family membrane protein [Paenibacillus larvae]MDR5566954.1 TcpD family membrane protein [Paenibacillus larvae]MDR5595051.1 TcpD family membrane protein [Paenibacillus larvae]
MPTLSGLSEIIKTEGGNALVIMLVIFAIVFIAKQKIGQFIFFLLLAGLCYFAIANPTSILGGIKALWNKVF